MYNKSSHHRDEYFTPDTRLAVEAIVVRAITEEGQVVIITIGKETIAASIR